MVCCYINNDGYTFDELALLTLLVHLAFGIAVTDKKKVVRVCEHSRRDSVELDRQAAA